MTAPLDPARYPVLLDEQCEVKVLLGKDQHTSVSTLSLSHTHTHIPLTSVHALKNELFFRVTLFLSWFKTAPSLTMHQM
jgi:hypothetical protein